MSSEPNYEQIEKIEKTENKIKSETGILIQMAIDKNFDIEKFRMLIELKNKEDEKKAEKEFEFHFSEMQKDYVPVIKNKSVNISSGKKAYSYCPLPEILNTYLPILSKHGFSCTWQEEQDGAEKKITCIISGYGHKKTASINLPIADKSAMANAIQARGITAEYGRRYSFMNVTGCIVKDESDTEGILPEDNSEKIKDGIKKLLPLVPINFRNLYIIQMGKAETIDELNNIFKNVTKTRNRCQAILSDAKLIGKTKDFLDGLNKCEDEENLLDWETKINDMKKV